MLYRATIDGKIISSYIKKADQFGTRLKGLMFKDKLNEGFGLWLMPCTQIHTSFMKVAIDVLYLAGDGTILGIDKGLKPWKIGKNIPGVNSVLELAENTVDKFNIEENQIVIFLKTEA